MRFELLIIVFQHWIAKAWGPVDGRPVFAIHGWLGILKLMKYIQMYYK